MLDNGYLEQIQVWTEDIQTNIENAESYRTETPASAMEAAAADIRRDCDALRAQLRETADFAQSQWHNARLSSQVAAYEQVLEDCQVIALRNQARSERSARTAHAGLLRVALRDVSSSRTRSREPPSSRVRASSEQPQRNRQLLVQPTAGPQPLRDPSVERIAVVNASAVRAPPCIMVPTAAMPATAPPMPAPSPGGVAYPAANMSGLPRQVVPPPPMVVPPQLSARGRPLGNPVVVNPQAAMSASSRSLSVPSAPPGGMARSRLLPPPALRVETLPPSPASAAGPMLSPSAGRVVFPPSAPLPPPPQRPVMSVQAQGSPASVVASPARAPPAVAQMVYVAAPQPMPSAREGLISSSVASPMYAPSAVLSAEPSAVPCVAPWVGQSTATSAETPVWAWPNADAPKAEEGIGGYVTEALKKQAVRMLVQALDKESMEKKSSAFSRWRKTALTEDDAFGNGSAADAFLRRLGRLERQRGGFRESSLSSPRRSRRQGTHDRDGVYEALTWAASVEGRSAASAERLLRILLGLRTTHLLLQSRQRLAVRAAFDQLGLHCSAKLKESGIYTAEQTFTFAPREVEVPSGLSIGDRVLAKWATTGEYYGATIASSNQNGTVTVDWDDAGASHRTVAADDVQKVPLMLGDGTSAFGVQTGSNGNAPYPMASGSNSAHSQQAGINGRDLSLAIARNAHPPSSMQESALQVRPSLPAPPSEPKEPGVRTFTESQIVGFSAPRSSSGPVPAGPIDEEQLCARLEEVQKEAQVAMQKAKRSSLVSMSVAVRSGDHSGQQESPRVEVQVTEGNFKKPGMQGRAHETAMRGHAISGKKIQLPMPTSKPTSFGPSGSSKDGVSVPLRRRLQTEPVAPTRDSLWDQGPEMAAAFGGPPSQPEVPFIGAAAGADSSESTSYGEAALAADAEPTKVKVGPAKGGLAALHSEAVGAVGLRVPQGPQKVLFSPRATAPASVQVPRVQPPPTFSGTSARGRAGTNLRFASHLEESDDAEECTEDSSEGDEWWETGADKMSRRSTGRSSTGAASRRSRADSRLSTTSATSAAASMAGKRPRAETRSASLPTSMPHFHNGFSKEYSTTEVGRRPTIAAKALGVAKDASRRSVARAFYEGAKVLHPDKGGAKDDFQVLNEAYMRMLAPRDNVS